MALYALCQFQKVDISINIQTKSKASTAEKADTKIRNKIKDDSTEKYWSATLKTDSDGNLYVTIGFMISYSQAINRVKSGKSVFTNYRKYAEKVAKTCSYRALCRYEIHLNNLYPYYYYHTNPRNDANDAHIWFLFF